QRYLGEKLQLEVKKLEKLERLSGDSVLSAPVFTENILTFPVAYGLALQGLKQARLLTNLLPPEIRTERLIKAKKPFAVAAAAALLLAVGGMTLGYAMTFRSFGGASIEKFADASKGASKTPSAPKGGAADASDDFGKALESANSELKSIADDKDR